MTTPQMEALHVVSDATGDPFRRREPQDKSTSTISCACVSKRCCSDRPMATATYDRAGSESSLAAGTLTTVGSNETKGTNDSKEEGSSSSELSSDDSIQHQHHQPDWAIPRWKELEGKRLALCRKRVQLERRLFESTLAHTNLSFAPPALPPSSGRLDDGDIVVTPNSDIISPSQPRLCLEHDGNSTCSSVFQIPNEGTVEWSGSVNETTGLPTGHGRMLFSDGQIYEGCCENGLRHGRGRNVWPLSTPSSSMSALCGSQVYSGEWIKGHREGRGTHCWPDGRTVTGTFKMGHLHGRVFFSWPDGASYDGDTANGVKHGRGIHTWANGRVYSGQYEEGYEHGAGMLTEANDADQQHSQYRGQFKHGARHGYGIQIWPTKTYEGDWCDNVVHGTGKLTWSATGASYTGQFYHGVYHGIGCYTSAGGASKYVGHWRLGVKEGKGRRHWPDGRVFEGTFRNSRPCGYGRMTFANGAEYLGGWKDGEFSGWGIAMAADGTTVVHCGLWAKNHPILKADVAVPSNRGHDDTGVEKQSTSNGKRARSVCSNSSVKLLVDTGVHDTLTLRCRSLDDMDWEVCLHNLHVFETGAIDDGSRISG